VVRFVLSDARNIRHSRKYSKMANVAIFIERREYVPTVLEFERKTTDDDPPPSPVQKTEYAHGSNIKIEDEADKSYEPSPSSQTLLSYGTQPALDDDTSTMMPYDRDPSDTAASAVKAFLSDDNKETKRISAGDEENSNKCPRCRSAPCVWIQKGHLVQLTHQQAVKRALEEQEKTTLPNWHLRRLYLAEMTIQMWGPLGWERKTMLPECVVTGVRGLFPEPNGMYNYPKWS
jgi:hypothetical protein